MTARPDTQHQQQLSFAGERTLTVVTTSFVHVLSSSLSKCIRYQTFSNCKNNDIDIDKSIFVDNDNDQQQQ